MYATILKNKFDLNQVVKRTVTTTLLTLLKVFHEYCECHHVILVHGYDGCNVCNCTYFKKSLSKESSSK